MSAVLPGQDSRKGWKDRLPWGRQAEDSVPVRMPGSRARVSQQPINLQIVDQALIWVVAALVLWGLVMVYSASIAMSDNPRFANYAEFHFVLRHSISIVIGTAMAILAFQVPISTWRH